MKMGSGNRRQRKLSSSTSRSHLESLPSKRMTQKVPVGVATKWAYQLMRGLAFIHGEGWIHRDVKPENLVIMGSNDGDLQIIDFGAAQRQNALCNGLGYQVQEKGLDQILDVSDMADRKDYTAPEVIDEFTRDVPASDTRTQSWQLDIYSAAQTLKELFSNLAPVRNQAHKKNIQAIRDLLDMASSAIPSERPNAAFVANRLAEIAATGGYAWEDLMAWRHDVITGEVEHTVTMPHQDVAASHNDLTRLVAMIGDIDYSQQLRRFRAAEAA